MKCHYEVLELSTDADDSEIKSAYRKLALKYHPDKNLDNPDEAKEQFQVVQQAYEVLSDKQERAWYDAHRDQILRGANSEFKDNSLDVFQYFTTTCFKGYGDDEKGFYTVYRGVFEQIAKEDVEFMDENEELCDIPIFGKSDSDYEEVKAFYNFWMSYSTKKSYSWLDPYDIREGKGDRRLSKLIEKENKKVRLKARKERNEEIRNLVGFVRKRDKRVQAYKQELEAKTLENRKKQELLSQQKRLERKKLHDTEKQADWLKFDNVQSELEEVERHLAKEFGEEISNSEDEDFNNLYCVACNKVFKTPKAFENHESSKKHRENVEVLRTSMLEDDIESNITDDIDEYDDLDDNEEDLDENIEDMGKISDEESLGDEENLLEISSGSAKKKKRKIKTRNTVTKTNVEDEDLHESEGEIKENGFQAEDKSTDEESEIILTKSSSKQSKKKNRKSKNVLSGDQNGKNDEVHEDTSIINVSDDDFDFGLSKSQKKKNKKSKYKQIQAKK